MSVVISRDLVLGTVDLDYPLTHARWGYRHITGTVSASSESAGSPASAASNPLTYTFWQPQSVTATWEIDAGTAQSVNYCGIAAHTLGDNGNTAEAQYWDGGSWVTLLDTNPGDNSPVMMLFETVSASRYRVRITGGTVPRLGVIWFGTTLDMQRPIYGGHTPITLARRTVYKNNVSERGQWLGRSIVRGGSATDFQWQHLTAEWYRANFDPLVEHLRTEPAFIAWRPLSYPNEVGYVWTNDDIAPSNMGIRDLMSVSVSVEGLGVE
jgi:hypothetical protein